MPIFQNPNANPYKKAFLYLLLLVIIKIFIEAHHFTLLVYVLLSVIFLIPEWISEYRPQFLAWIFVNRITVAAGTMIFCLGLGGYAFYRYPVPAGFYRSLEMEKVFLSIVVQGTLLGLSTRVLLTHLSYQLIRARSVFMSKMLILLIYAIFLIMVPLHDRYLLAPFFTACGVGFMTHFLSRVSERKNAPQSRVKQNLLHISESSCDRNVCNLTYREQRAIRLFAKGKSQKLGRLLHDAKQDTEVLFFIRISRLALLHEYGSALNLLSEKEKENPTWYAASKHFFHLHQALNKLRNGGNANEIWNDLVMALEIDSTCLLSHAVAALTLANEIDLGTRDPIVQAANKRKQEESLRLIWKAMNLYEQRETGTRLISLITGMTIPCTYTFLLDTYGYVLLKNGKLRFAKALLVQCLYQDPAYSATYLHLGEWLIECHRRSCKKNKNWEKAAKLNLHIALMIEQLNARNGNESVISRKARAILQMMP